MKKTALLLLCLLLLLAPGCAVSIEKTPASSSGTESQGTATAPPEPGQSASSGLFFWEVADGQTGGRLYLLGSIHVGRGDMYPLHDLVMNAYAASDILAVEADILALSSNVSAAVSLTRLMLYPGNDRIYNKIDPALYERAKGLLSANGLYGPALAGMQPIFWAITIEQLYSGSSGLSADYGVDMFFLKRAKSDRKAVRELESAEMQYEMLAALPHDFQEYYLASLLEQGAEGDETGRLLDVWLGGDIAALEQYLYAEDPDAPAELQAMIEDYNRALIDDRNAEMAKKAAESLASGEKCFFVVGAAHMAGKTGIVRQLEEMGYTPVRR